ncbi:MAG TPA: response regulator [Bryobacteraceae bacterium]|nr:response regulator [Bryobacteraceae bacterium]
MKGDGGHRILVVEDEEPVRTLICAMLAQSGYEIMEASNGEEALTLCEACRQPISVVLTDVVMPRMGGPELARRIKENAPETAVIFMSGYADQPVVEGAAEFDYGFIAKPFTSADLTRAVRGALERL